MKPVGREDKGANQPDAETSAGPALERWAALGLVSLLVVALIIPLSQLLPRKMTCGTGSWQQPPTFVGTAACRDCHASQFESWLGSDHDLAMDIATEETVRGDFNDRELIHDGMTSRFYRREGRYFVWTEGSGGEMEEFEVSHVFGHEPLQQYLVPFPGGRLQTVNLAWDTERREWFRMYPDTRIAADDWLHWTRNGQNWNGMCAECHSTNLRKNYDPATQTYATEWSDIDVGCEACHGPGSRHQAWAAIPPMGRPNLPNTGLVVPTTDIPPDRLVELCAPCHSRRAELSDYDHTGLELLDHMLPSLLLENLYYPDGQIQDEVFVYGSFIQSKMYARDVRCSDCHDSHSLKLHREGNELCLQCHQRETYDAFQHHFHKKEVEGKPSDGALCVKCHMMEQPFMVVDWRADHSLRIPRPDLNAITGAPDACSQIGCHGDKPLQWSVDAYNKWYGIARPAHFGPTLAAARKGEPGAIAELERLARDELHPAIVRATALDLTAGMPGAPGIALFQEALLSDEPLLRQVAAARLVTEDPQQIAELLAPLLVDPVKAVRLAAVSRLALVPQDLLKPYQREDFTRALAEYTDAMAYSLDFASSGFNLGNLYGALGDPESAERYYRLALEIDDRLSPVHGNLAMLLNAQGRNEEAEFHLRRAVELDPRSAALAYNLGLLLAELGNYEEAAEFLRIAGEGMPQRPRVQYNLGLVLQYLGRTEEATAALVRSAEVSGEQADYVLVLAGHLLQLGHPVEAEQWLDRLLAREPGHPEARQMKASLRR